MSCLRMKEWEGRKTKRRGTSARGDEKERGGCWEFCERGQAKKRFSFFTFKWKSPRKDRQTVSDRSWTSEGGNIWMVSSVAAFKDGLQLQWHRQAGLRTHAQPQAGGEWAFQLFHLNMIFSGPGETVSVQRCLAAHLIPELSECRKKKWNFSSTAQFFYVIKKWKKPVSTNTENYRKSSVGSFSLKNVRSNHCCVFLFVFSKIITWV